MDTAAMNVCMLTKWLVGKIEDDDLLDDFATLVESFLINWQPPFTLRPTNLIAKLDLDLFGRYPRKDEMFAILRNLPREAKLVFGKNYQAVPATTPQPSTSLQSPCDGWEPANDGTGAYFRLTEARKLKVWGSTHTGWIWKVCDADSLKMLRQGTSIFLAIAMRDAESAEQAIADAKPVFFPDTDADDDTCAFREAF